MAGMTFPTVIETPLRLEPVTRDPFGDAPSAQLLVDTATEIVPRPRSGRAVTER